MRIAKTLQMDSSIAYSRRRFVSPRYFSYNLYSEFKCDKIAFLIKYSFIITSSLLLFIMAKGAVSWAILNATFTGDSSYQCIENGGACWVSIYSNIYLIFNGYYPYDSSGRLIFAWFIISIDFLIFILLPFMGSGFAKRFKLPLIATIFFFLSPIVLLVLIIGVEGISVRIPTYKIGGILISFFTVINAIALGLPFGFLLAMGRSSRRLIVVKWFCTLIVEFAKAMPVAGLLMLLLLFLQGFLPESLLTDSKALTAILAFAISVGAYFAEAIRGCLQAVPYSQHEAALALGLTVRQKNMYVVLRQAMNTIVQSITYLSGACFKDTTFLNLLGMADMVCISMYISTLHNWNGTLNTNLIFCAGLYYVILCTTSYISEKIYYSRDENS